MALLTAPIRCIGAAMVLPAMRTARRTPHAAFFNARTVRRPPEACTIDSPAGQELVRGPSCRGAAGQRRKTKIAPGIADHIFGNNDAVELLF
jgi:hypothetical protein